MALQKYQTIDPRTRHERGGDSVGGSAVPSDVQGEDANKAEAR